MTPEGTNFCVFSKRSTRIDLLFFDGADDAHPTRVITLTPEKQRTFYYWHVFVRGVGAGQHYGYRAYGDYVPEQGLRFDDKKVLLDPYAQGIAIGENYDRNAAIRPGDNCAYAMKSVVADPSKYDWEDDIPLQMPISETVVYELHVGGFTRHPNSGLAPKKRGTYLGLIEKIPYLKSLGITAVELLPVMQFDEHDAPRGHVNYWGYSPIGFFAPHMGYSYSGDPLATIDEFRDMVKALHRAGIEVILDVVYNHTAEGDHKGPTYSFKGFENRAYYLLDAENRAFYANYSGCGNTLKGNHSIVRRLILDSLRYWVSEMHVDGFRFDLASVLARGESGQPLNEPPILWEIESDPVLAGAKLIAEAWDAAGLYQVGSFIGERWVEWNGHYRDDVRHFMKSDTNTITRLADRIVGSPDVYFQPHHKPYRSVNFITCHDGFTLNDLVSYNEKHNWANGQNNTDGADYNASWNSGIEGPTDDPRINALRIKQMKNYLTLLLFSHGTPMLLMGDEVQRTQSGNNNVYCQDNEISWFDWDLVEKNADFLRFVSKLIAFTQSRAIFREKRYWLAPDKNIPARITWHGQKLKHPDWSHHSHSLAFTLCYRQNGAHDHLHVMLNTYWKPLRFTLPELREGQEWHRLISTNLPAPEDFHDPQNAPSVPYHRYRVQARSIVVLLAQLGNGNAK